MHELLKGLSSDNDVDVLTLSDGTPDSGAAVEQLRADGFAVDPIVHRPPTSAAVLRSLRTGRSFYRTRFASDAFSLALQARIARHRYDVVQCEFAYMAQYAPAEPAHNGPRWILDAHNVEFRLNQTLAGIGQGSRGAVYRAYARREQRLRHSEELDACRRVDRVVSVSDTDRDVLLRELPGLGVDVVPNGVDVERFSPSLRPETDRAPSAIFVGKMDYRPNVDAVVWFCSEILPLIARRHAGFVFTICGGPTARSIRALSTNPAVRVLGPVADTRPFLDDAAVAVVPLRAGSGTRLKILEAMAMARPVVATSIASEGLDVDDGVHVMIGDTPEAIAERVVGLLESPETRRQIGCAGRELVEQRYGWTVAVARLEDVYRNALAGDGRRSQ